MRIILRLVVRECQIHWVRLVLAILAITATSALVVWTLGGYEQMSIDSQAEIKNYLGAYQLVLQLERENRLGDRNGFGPDRLAELRADPDVLAADSACKYNVRVLPNMSDSNLEDQMRQRIRMMPAMIPLIALEQNCTINSGPSHKGQTVESSEESPFILTSGTWLPNSPADSETNPTDETPVYCVAGQGLIDSLKMTVELFSQAQLKDIQVNDGFTLFYSNKTVPLKLAGIVNQGNSGSMFGSPPDHPRHGPGGQEGTGRPEGADAPDGIDRPDEAGPLDGHDLSNGTTEESTTDRLSDKSDKSSEYNNIGEHDSKKSSDNESVKNESVKNVQPDRSIFQSALYIRSTDLIRLGIKDFKPRFIYIRLANPSSVKSFQQRWQQRLASENIAATFMSLSDLEQAYAKSTSTSSIVNHSQASLIVTLFVALFIVFTTLCMGVSERTFQLALLRCVCLTRWQVSKLILYEALMLGVLGWLGGLGVGWLILAVTAWIGGSDPGSLSGTTIWVSCACAVTGSLLAAIVPAIKAARIKPMDALKQSRAIPRRRRILPITIIALILLAVNPWIVFQSGFSPGVKILAYTIYGTISMTVGFVLLAPAVVVITERLFSMPIALLFGMKSVFLKQQLSRNLWQSAGTVISLSIGLALFISIQIWGYSLLTTFMPKKDYPETIVRFSDPLAEPELDHVLKCPGLDVKSLFVLTVEQPKLSNQTMIDRATSGTNSLLTMVNSSVVVVGLDVIRALSPDLTNQTPPPFDLVFTEGSRQEAIDKFSDPYKRYCLVPDGLNYRVGDMIEVVKPKFDTRPSLGEMFQQMDSGPEKTAKESGKPDKTDKETVKKTARKKSQKTNLQPPGGLFGGGFNPLALLASGDEKPEHKVKYEVAGVVQWPGVQVMTIMAGMNVRHELGSLILTRMDQARTDYDSDSWRFFWFNSRPGTRFADQEKFFNDWSDSVKQDRLDQLQHQYEACGITFSDRSALELDWLQQLALDSGDDKMEEESQEEAQEAESESKSKSESKSNPSSAPESDASTELKTAENKTSDVDMDMTSNADEEFKPVSESSALVRKGQRLRRIRIIQTENIRSLLSLAGDKIIQQFVQMPLIILCITTIAVLNTVVASVRTRRWEIGLLRAISLTRSQIARLILAETLLIGLAATVLSLTFGLFSAWCSLSMLNQTLSGFIHIPMILRWDQLLQGIGIVMVLCTIASVFTAWQTSRIEPSVLLQRRQ